MQQQVMIRPEVLAKRAERLEGKVTIFVPTPWRVIAFFLFLAVSLALVYLALARFERLETVTGEIVPDRGVASIVARSSAVVAELKVKEGQAVKAGTVLAILRDGSYFAEGSSAAEVIARTQADQAINAGAQAIASRDATLADRMKAEAQQRGLRAELASLDTQVRLQQRLVSSARADLERVEEIAKRGYVSARDVQARRDSVLQREMQLVQLEQAIVARQSDLEQSQREIAKSAADVRSVAATASVTQAQLAQQAATARVAREQAVVAPFAGQVSSLTVRVGQPVEPNQIIMSLIPDQAVLEAQLAIPSTAIGFVKVGQEARLALDSFPYQHFGTLSGKVASIGASPVERSGPDGRAVRVYPVTVSIRRRPGDALGSDRQMRAGMTLTARIVAEERSLLEWLFEPLYAVGRR